MRNKIEIDWVKWKVNILNKGGNSFYVGSNVRIIVSPPHLLDTWYIGLFFKDEAWFCIEMNYHVTFSCSQPKKIHEIGGWEMEKKTIPEAISPKMFSHTAKTAWLCSHLGFQFKKRITNTHTHPFTCRSNAKSAWEHVLAGSYARGEELMFWLIQRINLCYLTPTTAVSGLRIKVHDQLHTILVYYTAQFFQFWWWLELCESFVTACGSNTQNLQTLFLFSYSLSLPLTLPSFKSRPQDISLFITPRISSRFSIGGNK